MSNKLIIGLAIFYFPLWALIVLELIRIITKVFKKKKPKKKERIKLKGEKPEIPGDRIEYHNKWL